MTELHHNVTEVRGAGVAESKIPGWISFIRLFGAILVSLLILTTIFHFVGWPALIEAIFERNSETVSSRIALVIATLLTLSLALSTFISYSKLTHPMFGLKKNSQNKTVYSGFKSSVQPLGLLTLMGVLSFSSLYSLLKIFGTFPLASDIHIVKRSAAPPMKDEGLLPIYFWDYATWFDPKWMDKLDLSIPYEKGPPEKLLAKIFFKNIVSNDIEVELHGRRPRSYSKETVTEAFASLSQTGRGSSVYRPKYWSSLYWIQKETGAFLNLNSAEQNLSLSLIELNQETPNITRAIGTSWFEAGSLTPHTNSESRAFFWGPDGSVFQFKCKLPCTLERFFDLVQFPDDPRGSYAARKEWTAGTIRELLSQLPLATGANLALKEKRAQHERLLYLYLVSLISLDPRDPEAFFHLGKLAQNKETVQSAINYGRDLKLEAAKVAELEARLNSM